MVEFQVVVIGAGPGGYLTAIKLAQLGQKVALVENDKLGGECLNYGCIPSKTMINTSDMYHKIAHLSTQGIDVASVSVDLSEEIMKEYEKEIELNSYKILEDNFAPVENYLNPLTGKQYVKRIILEDGIASEISNDGQDWNPELTVNQLLVVSIAAVVLVYSIYSYSNTEKN